MSILHNVTIDRILVMINGYHYGLSYETNQLDDIIVKSGERKWRCSTINIDYFISDYFISDDFC